MNIDLFRADIEFFLREYAFGRVHAVPRHHLLRYLHTKGWTVSDRTLRRVYADIPFVGYAIDGEKRGLFWITTREERKETERHQHSKAMSELVREKRIRDGGQTGQRELFG